MAVEALDRASAGGSRHGRFQLLWRHSMGPTDTPIPCRGTVALQGSVSQRWIQQLGIRWRPGPPGGHQFPGPHRGCCCTLCLLCPWSWEALQLPSRSSQLLRRDTASPDPWGHAARFRHLGRMRWGPSRASLVGELVSSPGGPMGVLGTLQSDRGAEGSHRVLNTLALITAFIPIIIHLFSLCDWEWLHFGRVCPVHGWWLMLRGWMIKAHFLSRVSQKDSTSSGVLTGGSQGHRLGTPQGSLL